MKKKRSFLLTVAFVMMLAIFTSTIQPGLTQTAEDPNGSMTGNTWHQVTCNIDTTAAQVDTTQVSDEVSPSFWDFLLSFLIAGQFENFYGNPAGFKYPPGLKPVARVGDG